MIVWKFFDINLAWIPLRIEVHAGFKDFFYLMKVPLPRLDNPYWYESLKSVISSLFLGLMQWIVTIAYGYTGYQPRLKRASLSCYLKWWQKRYFSDKQEFELGSSNPFSAPIINTYTLIVGYNKKCFQLIKNQKSMFNVSGNDCDNEISRT